MEIKILVFCHSFYPQSGGQEIVAHLLAEGWADRGIPVKVVTRSPGIMLDKKQTKPNYEIITNPDPWHLLRLIHWSTLCFSHSISLRQGILMVLYRKTWFVLHHILYEGSGITGFIKKTLKRSLMSFPYNLYCSAFVQEKLGHSGNVLPNAYNDEIFKLTGRVKSKHLLVAGRLVKNKGQRVAIKALKILREKEFPGLTMTVAGDGPERPALETFASDISVRNAVLFKGELTAFELAAQMNDHRILIVPSTYDEPFGMVVIEGLACGCIPVVSNIGGLPEAVFGQGILFTPGDPNDLAQKLQKVLGSIENYLPDSICIGSRLHAHSQSESARAFMDHFLTVI